MLSQVLKEVEPNVSNIIISSDGSWTAVMESDDTVTKPVDKTSNSGQDDDSPQPSNILDLTLTDDVMDDVPTYEAEDRKHPLLTQTTAVNPNTNNGNQSGGQVDNDFWSGMYMSTFGSSNAQPNELTSGAFASSSVLAESFINSPNGEVEAFQYQFGNASVSNEYGRFPSVPRHITRTPTAVQALPAQTPTSVLQRSSTNRLNSCITNGLSSSLPVPPSAPNSTRSFPDPRQVSPMSSSSLIQVNCKYLAHDEGLLQCEDKSLCELLFKLNLLCFRHATSTIHSFYIGFLILLVQQNWEYPSARLHHQNAGFPDQNQVPHIYSSTQQMTNLRVNRATSPSPGSMLRHGADVTRSQQSHLVAAANRAAQMSVDASRTVPVYPWNSDGRNIPTPPGDQRGSSAVNNPADLSWRPPGRMRGALSGQAYSDYFNQIISRPNQQAQGARPISNLTNVRPPLQALVAGGIIEETPPPNYPNSMGSDILPNSSSGVN